MGAKAIKMDDKFLDNKIIKSNELVEAPYKLSVREQRIILVLASLIKKDDEDFKPYRFKINDLLKVLDIKNKKEYRELEEITKQLKNKGFTLQKEKSRLQINWLSSAEYFDGEGIIELEFSPKLKPYLLLLKEQFTQYALRDIIQLKSSYSIRLYELLKQYEKLKERKFELENLRQKLGIEKEEYKKYFDFKKRVILKAQKELKEKTDLYFDFEELKTGRKVTAINFLIFSKASKKKEKPLKIEDLGIKPIEDNLFTQLEKDSNFDKELFSEMVDIFGISEAQSKSFLEEYSKEHIEKALSIAKEDFLSGKVKGGLTPYAVGVIKKYSSKKSKLEEKEETKREEEKKQRELETLKQKKNREILETLPSEYEKIAKEKAQSYLDELPKGARELINLEFQKTLESQTEIKEFSVKGIESPIIRWKFTKFIANRFLEESYQSVTNYAKTKGIDLRQIDNGFGGTEYKVFNLDELVK